MSTPARTTVLIMGPPGAGKGTQAAHLVDEYGLRHVSTGDALRAAVAAQTEAGVAAKSYMDVGNLVPDDVTLGVLRDVVADLGPGEGVLFDGYPRNVAQARSLDEMLAGLNRMIDVVLDIHVPRDELIARLGGRWICRKCGAPYNVNSKPPAQEGVCDVCGGELYQRDDDTAEAVGNRLDVYAEQTAPVSAFYDDRKLRVQIDGNQPMNDVQAQIDRAMRGDA